MYLQDMVSVDYTKWTLLSSGTLHTSGGEYTTSLFLCVDFSLFVSFSCHPIHVSLTLSLPCFLHYHRKSHITRNSHGRLEHGPEQDHHRTVCM